MLFVKAIFTLGAQALVHGHRPKIFCRHNLVGYPICNCVHICSILPVQRPILNVRVVGNSAGSRPWDKGEGRGLSSRPLDKVGGSPKGPSGLSLVSKITGGLGPSAPLPWTRHWKIGYAKHWISPELMHTRDSCHTRAWPCSQALEPCSFAQIIYYVNTWKNVFSH